MTQQEQADFVRELSQTITESVLASILAGRVPETWDGIELRRLLADRFEDNTRKMPRTRQRDYSDNVIVNNL